MDASDRLTQLWTEDFHQGGVPTSVRQKPSHAALALTDFLNAQKIRTGGLLDVGCGNGRNSLHFAEAGWRVTSVDLIEPTLEALRQKATASGLAEKIQTQRADLSQVWPLPDRAFDVVFDSFCYFHLMTENGQECYTRELARVLRPGGYFSLTVMGRDDGYYGQHLISDALQAGAMRDPANGLEGILYEPAELLARFGAGRKLLVHEHQAPTNVIHGQEHRRSVHRFLWQTEA